MVGSHYNRPGTDFDPALAPGEWLLVDVGMSEYSSADDLVIDHDFPPVGVAVPP